MADANAQAAKPAPAKPTPPIPANQAAAAPAAAAAAKPAAQTLRQVQVKKIALGNFKPIGHFTEPFQAQLPDGWDFEDALNPDFWSFVAPSMQANASISGSQDRLGTIVEILAKDHAFYGIVYVKRLRKNAQGQADGAYVVCVGPIVDPKTGVACPVDLATGGPWRGRKPAAEPGEAAKAA